MQKYEKKVGTYTRKRNNYNLESVRYTPRTHDCEGYCFHQNVRYTPSTHDRERQTLEIKNTRKTIKI